MVKTDIFLFDKPIEGFGRGFVPTFFSIADGFAGDFLTSLIAGGFLICLSVRVCFPESGFEV